MDFYKLNPYAKKPILGLKAMLCFIAYLILSACSAPLPLAETELGEPILESFGPIQVEAFSWSHDDQSVYWQAYLHGVNGPSSLFVTHLSSQETRQFDVDGKRLMELSVSSDGDSIYFVTTDVPDMDPCWYHYTLSSDKLEPFLCDAFDDYLKVHYSYTKDFSPDGRYFAANTIHESSYVLLLYDLKENQASYLVEDRLFTTVGTKIETHFFSPDGKQILVRGMDGSFYKVTITTGVREQVDVDITSNDIWHWTDEGIQVLYPDLSFSPDNVDSVSSFKIQNLSTDKEQIVSIEPGYFFYSDNQSWVWSKNGRSIAFQTVTCLASKYSYWYGQDICVSKEFHLNVHDLQTNKTYIVAKHSGAFTNYYLSNAGTKIVYFAYDSLRSLSAHIDQIAN